MANKYIQRVQWVKILTHLIILVFIFVTPELLFNVGHKTPRLMYVAPLCYILLFYLNYYVLIDRCLFGKKRKWGFYVINLAVIIGVMVLIYNIRSFPRPEEMRLPPFVAGKMKMMPPPHDEGGLFRFIDHHTWMRIMKCVPQIFPILMSVCLAVLMKLGEKQVKWNRLEKEIDAERKENELKNLKNQLNPHFLFNTLNNIYALIAISQPKAQQAVHELSQLLRYVLYDNNVHEVSLEKDLLFVKNYIALMQLRLSSSVKLTVSINEKDGLGKTIAPLMFISLVENAFKHGVSVNHPSYIDISIKVVGDMVKCRVENSCFPKGAADKSGSGIGISNLRRQLGILYPDAHRFEIMNQDNKYISELDIKLTSKK